MFSVDEIIESLYKEHSDDNFRITIKVEGEKVSFEDLRCLVDFNLNIKKLILKDYFNYLYSEFEDQNLFKKKILSKYLSLSKTSSKINSIQKGSVIIDFVINYPVESAIAYVANTIVLDPFKDILKDKLKDYWLSFVRVDKRNFIRRLEEVKAPRGYRIGKIRVYDDHAEYSLEPLVDISKNAEHEAIALQRVKYLNRNKWSR